MRNIEIQTSQNVTISYHLAQLKDRFFAWVMDILVILLIILILSLVSTSAFSYFNIPSINVFFIDLLVLLYFPICEVLMNGQTPGKKMVGLKIIKLNGRQPLISDYLIRWVFRLADITLSLGSIGALLISTTDRNQRLGGLLSDTVVIRIKPEHMISVTDLLKMHESLGQEVVYRGVLRFSEADMLIMKRVIQRYNQSNNRANTRALGLLTIKVADQLGIERPTTNKTKFIRQVIKDYVILTR